MMPLMDGFELAGRIRQEPGWEDLKMLMLTSGGRTVHADRCHALGILDCLLKPISQSELYNALMRSFEPTEASSRGIRELRNGNLFCTRIRELRHGSPAQERAQGSPRRR